MSATGYLPFEIIFWIFLFFCVFGVILEGTFCVIVHKHWESHVLSVWGWFNFLYGIGSVWFFEAASGLQIPSFVLKVLVIAAGSTLIELAGGLLLKYGLGMRAWDYSDRFLHLDGLICPFSFLCWTVMAVLICLTYQKFVAAVSSFRSPLVDRLAVYLFIFLVIDFLLAAVCMVRWSRRHYGTARETRIGALIDRLADDEWMSRRFIEWKFIN